MVDLKTLGPNELEYDGWQSLLARLPAVVAAETDPYLFRQLGRFKTHMRHIVKLAVQINVDQSQAAHAYDFVKENKLLFRNKTLDRFKDIQKQTYTIALDALQRDFDNLYQCLVDRNLETMENQYRIIKKWPKTFEAA